MAQQRAVLGVPITLGTVFRIIALFLFFFGMVGLRDVGPIATTVEQWIAGGLFFVTLGSITG